MTIFFTKTPWSSFILNSHKKKLFKRCLWRWQRWCWRWWCWWCWCCWHMVTGANERSNVHTKAPDCQLPKFCHFLNFIILFLLIVHPGAFYWNSCTGFYSDFLRSIRTHSLRSAQIHLSFSLRCHVLLCCNCCYVVAIAAIYCRKH